MIYEIETKEKVLQLSTIFENLKKVCDYMNFVIGKNGIYTQGMDGSHICCLELNLTPDWFDKSKVNDKEYNIGINCEILANVFRCLEPEQSIKITYMENSTEELLVYFEGGGVDKMFEIPLMDIDTEQLGIPDADYSADIVINSNDFHHMLSQLNHFGSKLKFKLGYDDNIYIRTEGDLGKMQVRIKDEDIVEYVLEEEKMFEVDFGIRFLERFCGFSKVNHFVNLHISENIPMKMQYNLSNWKENTSEENYIDKNYIKIYLAPLVEDD